MSSPTTPEARAERTGTRHRGGLTSVEAAARLQRDGPNLLPVARGPGALRQLVRQFVHLFAVMLWVAAGLAVVAGLRELAIAIVAVLVANALFAFAQEHRAERAAAHLRRLLPARATAVRDGHRATVDAAQLVVGDLVLLEPGDRVCADLRIEEVHGLGIDASMLTGESEPVQPDVGADAWAGTHVVEGDAAGVVTATGARTRLAGITALTTTGTRRPTPLAHELHRLVRTLATIAVGIGIAFFLVGLALDVPLDEGFVFAIGITVALVPEGLLPTVTLTLGLGAQRMAREHALVRRLDAVETLGSTTVICTDKTGTLTANRLTVVEAWTPAGGARTTTPGYDPAGRVEVDDGAADAIPAAAVAAARCSTGRVVPRGGDWVAEGDTTDAAIHAFALRVAGSDLDLDDEPVVRRWAFDARRRRMATLTTRRVVVKGAPDGVLPLCSVVPDGAQAALEAMAEAGLRVIAVAEGAAPAVVPSRPAEVERDLALLGLLGLEDPPRPGAAEAVADCRRAGVRLAMVTGDHPATALAIAREVGLSRDGQVLLGADLPDDLDALGRVLAHDGVVVARAAPEDKLRIARALQARGDVVAMTGDGVNDGPALHQADIGVAMGASGTDVARESADLVLLDDDFATIVTAIAYGRATFSNVRRFLTYHLTDNVAELTPFVVWGLSGGRIPLALTVLQVLALDLGTDTFSAVALGAEPPRRSVLDRPPVSGRLLDRRVARRAFGLLGPVEAALGMGAFLLVMLLGGWHPGGPVDQVVLLRASGATFATLVLAQTANAFACRSTRRWAGGLGWTSNPLLVGAVLVELAITAVFLFQPGLARALRHVEPGPVGWAVAVGSIMVVVAVDAAEKAWHARRPPRPAPRRPAPPDTR